MWSEVGGDWCDSVKEIHQSLRWQLIQLRMHVDLFNLLGIRTCLCDTRQQDVAQNVVSYNILWSTVKEQPMHVSQSCSPSFCWGSSRKILLNNYDFLVFTPLKLSMP